MDKKNNHSYDDYEYDYDEADYETYILSKNLNNSLKQMLGYSVDNKVTTPSKSGLDNSENCLLKNQ